MNIISSIRQKLTFDRNELSGSFGDIGTDLPLIIGMILASGMDSASVLIVVGVMQIFTAVTYGIPMPVQPLKAVAAIVIANKITGNIIFAGGLAIGITMLFLTLTGLVVKLSKVIPKSVIRGIQFGLGLTLATTASKQYMFSEPGFWGYVIVLISFILTIVLIGNRKYPPAIFIIAIGIIYSFVFKMDDPVNIFSDIKFETPNFFVPSWSDMVSGFIILALPQIPLSLGNSIFASDRVIKDLFPHKKIGVKKIGFTYSIINLISPFFSGIPVCHGSGGIAGHYAFGGRTGGSVFIYGLFYLVVGLFFSHNFEAVANIFPLPILGVILFFEALMLILFIKDLLNNKTDLFIAILVGLIAALVPYGFLIGLISGTILHYLAPRILFFRR